LKDKNNCLKIKNYYFNIFPIEKKLQPLFQTPTPLNGRKLGVALPFFRSPFFFFPARMHV
jgi:hypothetical protein